MPAEGTIPAQLNESTDPVRVASAAEEAAGFLQAWAVEAARAERLSSELAEANAENERLRKALKPFSDAAETLISLEKDYGVFTEDAEVGRIDESRERPSYRIRVAHLRAARSALTGGQ